MDKVLSFFKDVFLATCLFEDLVKLESLGLAVVNAFSLNPIVPYMLERDTFLLSFVLKHRSDSAENSDVSLDLLEHVLQVPSVHLLVLEDLEEFLVLALEGLELVDLLVCN